MGPIAVAATTLVNISLLCTLSEVFGIYYFVSNALGILCGTAFNFLVNDRWTFKHGKGDMET
jgi:putative flippase GtrA